jgi:hypothetical protein
MSNWRISSFSGALLAGYFIPNWASVAYTIMMTPVRGLYERPSVSVALYASDHLQIASMETVRFAWLLALGRMTVVAFFALFLVLTALSFIRKQTSGGEALAIALGVGSALSFACMIMASKVGEAEALRLHATELLMMLGTGIVMLFDRPAAPKAADVRSEPDLQQAEELPLQQAELGYNS